MNVFGIGPPELIAIMIVALIIFGPQKLPEIGAQLGKAIRDFRQMTNDVTGEFNRTMTLDAPPPAADLAPKTTAEETASAHANGSGGAGAGEMVTQTTAPDPIVSGDATSVSAEEPWTAPESTVAPPEATRALVATKADPLAGAALLDAPAVSPVATTAAPAGGETIVYRPAPAPEAGPETEHAPATDVTSSSADAWEAVATTEATAPLVQETAEPDRYVYEGVSDEPIADDRHAEAVAVAAPGVEDAVTIREKVEAQVAAEAFRDRRRRASYNRPRGRG